MNRRELLMAGLAAAAPAPAAPQPPPLEDRICVFTDPFDGPDGFTLDGVAGLLDEVGVAGPDLTVRPGGLVLPERVEQDLPKAHTAFEKRGLSIPMISTSLTETGPEAEAVLGTASRLGIPYYKIGYYPYEDMSKWRQTQADAAAKLRGLVALSKKHKIHAGLHNHSGPIVGGFLWDMAQVLEPLDKEWIGVYADPAHSVIEGGKNGWNFSLRQVLDQITMVGVKDFVWEKVKGKWQTRWVPLGEGMVPFDEVFAILSQVAFPGPISLHIEYYEPSAPTRAARLEKSAAVLEKDVVFLRGALRKAQGRSAG